MLKQNGYTEQGINKTTDPLKKAKGNPYSIKVIDKDGNVIGRIDKNYRVDGKVVPEYIHLLN